MKVSGINLSSKEPKKLADFYKNIGVDIFLDGDNYDGWNLGEKEDNDRISVWIWDENKWETSSEGYITIVLNSDNIENEYTKLKEIIPNIEPPFKAKWGGIELKLVDPDGNKVLIL